MKNWVAEGIASDVNDFTVQPSFLEEKECYLCNTYRLFYIPEVKISLFCLRKKNQRRNHKIQPRTCFDLNDLKTSLLGFKEDPDVSSCQV